MGLGFSDCWSCSDPGQSGFENAGGGGKSWVMTHYFATVAR